MKKSLSIVPRSIPALIMMLVIFIVSSQPGDNLPNFLTWDYVVKKASHAIGYGLLALSYLYLLKNHPNKYWLAWLMTVLYSVTDEFHQSFVFGRNGSVYDVVVFDDLGALIALGLHTRYWKKDEEEINQA